MVRCGIESKETDWPWPDETALGQVIRQYRQFPASHGFPSETTDSVHPFQSMARRGTIDQRTPFRVLLSEHPATPETGLFRARNGFGHFARSYTK
jgi:hypothetical protein